MHHLIRQFFKNLSNIICIFFISDTYIENIKRKLNAVTALLCVSANDVDTVAWDEASVEKLIEEVKRRKLDGVDLDARGSIEREAVERFHHADLSCCFWTVDDPAGCPGPLASPCSFPPPAGVGAGDPGSSMSIL